MHDRRAFSLGGASPRADMRRALVRALALLPTRPLAAHGLVPLLAAPAVTVAQAWPAQPIRLIVPYTPAGATDILARMLAGKLQAATGWSIVVDNRPGAGGNIGLDAVAKARPDGYTLGVGQTANLAINPSLLGRLPFDPRKDFTPIAFIAQQPVVLVVRAESPHGTLAELVRAARARPGGLTMASAGTGTVGHLAGELLLQRADARVVHAPYKGAAPALADLIGGHVDFMLPTPQAALPLIKAGKLRALAVTSARRLPVLPDTPTVADSGYPGFEASDWKALIGPAGLPPAIVERLSRAVESVLGTREVLSQLLQEGSAPMAGTPKQLEAFMASEAQRWGRVVREAGVKPD